MRRIMRVLLKTVFMIEIIFISLVQISSNASAQLADSPWPMIHGSAQHGGLSPYNTSHVDGTILWTFKSDGPIETSPAIGENGTIYFGDHKNKFYAINPNGTLKWKFDAGDPFPIVDMQGYETEKGILSSPAIASDGTIYFTSFSNYLYALNSDGTEKWRYPVHIYVDVWSSPVIGSDGTIYVGSQQYPPGDVPNIQYFGILYAINSDGTLKWKYDSGSSGMCASPAIGHDRTVYAAGGAGEGELSYTFAFNPANGAIKWRFQTNLWQESSPSVGSDGTIYIGSKEGYIHALNPANGNVIWRYQTNDGVSAIPAIGEDGTIYVGSWDATFYALTPEGEEIWHFETPPALEAISTSAAIGTDGTIYFGAGSGNFYALNQDGTEKWRLKASSFSSSPAIGSDGTIYVGCYNHKLYAFGGPDNERKQSNEEVTIIFEEDVTEEQALSLLDSHTLKYLFSSALWESKSMKLYLSEDQQNMFIETLGNETIVSYIGTEDKEEDEEPEEDVQESEKEDNSTPGFEIILALIAVLIVLLMKKKKTF
ncbi:MAG: PQQ-binding-like beta-propeller repeat protein [Thermoplasmatales archaeon]|nr:MAG: PQQ-binding-like beta-propeller repeat protein [Thermoplasmatales archaeon]